MSNKEKETLKFKPSSDELNETEVSPLFILGKTLLVVPAKLARRMLRGEYMDMAKLLKDNMEREEIGTN